jgi:hypothetical protein
MLGTDFRKRLLEVPGLPASDSGLVPGGAGGSCASIVMRAWAPARLTFRQRFIAMVVIQVENRERPSKPPRFL